MNQQPDKLFREKLEGYLRTAPTAAWEKIAAAQPKKNNKELWFKIAASLLLLAVAAFLLRSGNDKPVAQHDMLTAASTEQPDHLKAPQNKQNSNVLPEKEVQQEALTKTEKPSPKRGTVQAAQIQEVKIVQETMPDATVPLSTPEEIVTHATATESTETIIAEAQVVPAPETENITLVFTAGEVNEYLDKKALAQATSDEKKPSTLKKLLKKANDLKNNQDPFGELRQKKNEILALNFKSEKQRGQNK